MQGLLRNVQKTMIHSLTNSVLGLDPDKPSHQVHALTHRWRCLHNNHLLCIKHHQIITSQKDIHNMKIPPIQRQIIQNYLRQQFILNIKLRFTISLTIKDDSEYENILQYYRKHYSSGGIFSRIFFGLQVPKLVSPLNTYGETINLKVS